MVDGVSLGTCLRLIQMEPKWQVNREPGQVTGFMYPTDQPLQFCASQSICEVIENSPGQSADTIQSQGPRHWVTEIRSSLQRECSTAASFLQMKVGFHSMTTWASSNGSGANRRQKLQTIHLLLFLFDSLLSTCPFIASDKVRWCA